MLEALTRVQTPDEVLVPRARAGDRPACEELFERHRSDSYQVAYRLLGHEQDALDVVQESMLKAFLALGDFDGRSGFRTWLLRIVTNTALDWGRRRKRRPSTAVEIATNRGWSRPQATIPPDDYTSKTFVPPSIKL